MSIKRICELIEHMANTLDEMANDIRSSREPREYLEVADDCYYGQNMAEDGWVIERPGSYRNFIVSRPRPMKGGEE